MAAWRDAQRWEELRVGTRCPFCSEEPSGVLAATPTSWVTTAEEVTCRGYVCVIARRHVVEPFDLPPDEIVLFFSEVARVADTINRLFRPVKLNYEIHGNTIPHLHMHVFPRYVGDPFEGGPIRGAERHAAHSPADIARMSNELAAALSSPG